MGTEWIHAAEGQECEPRCLQALQEDAALEKPALEAEEARLCMVEGREEAREKPSMGPERQEVRVKPGMNPLRFNYVWREWAFRANFMYKSVL